MTILENIAARNAYTARLCPDQVIPKVIVPATAAEAPEALFGWLYKQDGMATKAGCQAMLARVSAERSPEDAKALLQRFGVDSVKSLFTGQYENFFEYASTSLYLGVSPTAGWTCAADVRVEDRDRFLFYHDGSDSLMQHKGPLPDGAYPECNDVSGVLAYEQRFVQAGGKL